MKTKIGDCFSGQFAEMPFIEKVGMAPVDLTRSEALRRLRRGIWTTADGQVIHISAMSPDHIFYIAKSYYAKLPTNKETMKSRWVDLLIAELERRDNKESKEALLKIILIR